MDIKFTPQSSTTVIKSLETIDEKLIVPAPLWKLVLFGVILGIIISFSYIITSITFRADPNLNTVNQILNN